MSAAPEVVVVAEIHAFLAQPLDAVCNFAQRWVREMPHRVFDGR